MDLMVALRVAVSLACVVGLIWIAGRKLSGPAGRRPAAGPQPQVLGRQSLGRHTGVAVLAVGGRRLLVGYGDQQGVNLLTELAPVLEPAPAGPRPTAVRRPSALRRVIGLGLLPRAWRPALGPAEQAGRSLDALVADLSAGRAPGPAVGAALAGRPAAAPATRTAAPHAPALDVHPTDALLPVTAHPHGSAAARRGGLDGSILSRATWRRAVGALQDRTVRR